MTQISKIINQEKNDLQILKNEVKQRRFTINISSEDFKELFLLQANKIIISRNIHREFEITDQNKTLINLFWHYLINDDENFKVDLNKGVMILGKNGVGKTLILKSFCNMINLLSNKKITQIHSKKLPSSILEKESGYYEKRPLFIDDIGKEAKEVNDFGTKILPVADLMALRYDNGSLTFATCNYKFETLTEFYGLTTTDRFKEMFNIFILEGESFRK